MKKYISVHNQIETVADMERVSLLSDNLQLYFETTGL